MERKEILQRIKKLIVERLNLDISPDDIKDDEPLFADGLGLDSIDALELVLALEQEFGVKVEDQESVMEAFTSVADLCNFVEQHLKI